MPSPKVVNRWGVLAKLETTEGTYTDPSALTDGILCVERPAVATDWIHPGERAHPTLKNVPKTGRGHTFTLVHEPAGAGAAYSASVLPSPHLLFRACGLAVAIDTTTGAEKVTYTPGTPGTYASLSGKVYDKGQEYRLAAMHAKFTFEAENGGIGRLTFECNGISAAMPTDAPVPAITYAGAQAVDPAVAVAMELLIGSWHPARIKSIKLTQGMEWTPRYLDNTGKHGGYNYGAEPSYELEVVVEAEALSSYNPYQVAEEAASAALSATFGSGSNYRSYRITAPNAQLTGVPEQDENNAALWALTYQLKPSSFMGTDHFAFEFIKGS